jgi:NagD protein
MLTGPIALKPLQDKQAFLCNMDGVLYHGNRLLPGVLEFVDWLHQNDKQFFF